ncbi:phosphate signaling complex protein PhoU [Bacillus massilinigeriensis]|uniref:phosphate signaling complex protein PhoU n=1 Tax=Bacillus massilionigeriensis TaxID=1805475 RepID=UPI00096B06D0|nr:phosphate signaling complex protein PhoU [Bacillus massilionigeriensis]
MVVREKFHYDMNELRNKLTELGKFANDALRCSIETLESKNIDRALEILDNDTKADVLYEEINDFSILLIAKQQPVAIDLRRIIVAIKIAADLERIADFAVNIAKSTIRIGKEEHVGSMAQIREMFERTSEMIELSLEAFNEEDVDKAHTVLDMDDVVDSFYGQTIRQLLQINQSRPELLSQITQLSFVCRYLERAADHTTNIAESVFYLVKGKHYEINN